MGHSANAGETVSYDPRAGTGWCIRAPLWSSRLISGPVAAAVGSFQHRATPSQSRDRRPGTPIA
jgi:hypothetical protein